MQKETDTETVVISEKSLKVNNWSLTKKKSVFAEQIERTSVYFFLHASISKVQLIRTYQDTIWMTLDGVKCNVHDVAYPSRGA